MDDRLALLEAEALQHRIHPLGAEDPHQVVFERDKELRGSGVALAARAAAQLVVDAPALVPLAADDKKAARLDHILVRRLNLFTNSAGPRLAHRRVLDRRQ